MLFGTMLMNKTVLEKRYIYNKRESKKYYKQLISKKDS